MTAGVVGGAKRRVRSRAAVVIGWATGLALGLAMCFVGGSPARLAADEFEHVELPAIKTGEPEVFTLAKPVKATAETIMFELLSPPPPDKGMHFKYDIVPTPSAAGAAPGTTTWNIELVAKVGANKTVARLALQGDTLFFRWEPAVSRVEGGPLRNCLLRFRDGGPQREIVLRQTTQLPAMPLDLKKDIVRLPVGDDLPDISLLALQLDSLTDAPDGGQIGQSVGKVKESCFVELKPAEAEAPGARLRAVLWKAGSKTEVLLRPELTPMLKEPPPGALGAGGGTTSGTATGATRVSTPPAMNSSADSFNPDAPTLAFTTRGLAAIKTQLQRNLQAAEGQLLRNNATIAAGERELSKWAGGIVGTIEEIRIIQRRIDNIQQQNRLLSAENQKLETIALPAIKKQLWACPKMEQLSTTLHEKAKLSFRVMYPVGDKYVDLLLAAGDGPAGEGQAKTP